MGLPALGPKDAQPAQGLNGRMRPALPVLSYLLIITPGEARPQKTLLMSLLNRSWTFPPHLLGKQVLLKELFNPLWAGSSLRTLSP